MNENLKHVVEGNCTDPDCEIHNIEVAIEEGVINDTNLAYWFAGLQVGLVMAADATDGLDRDVMKDLLPRRKS